MKTRPFKQVDVFTREPFMGNPVAVVIGAEELTAEAMQRIAAWTNLSETTFILPSERADYRLRIFTPKRELGFAGHPVIGSAHAALESGYAAARAGVIRQEWAAGIFVRAPGPKISGFDASDALASALGTAVTNSPLLIETGPLWIVADLGAADK